MEEFLSAISKHWAISTLLLISVHTALYVICATIENIFVVCNRKAKND